MRKLILIAAIALFISDICISQQADNYVLLGQLYYTQPHSFFERLKGKVKEFRQTNWLAKQENGKVVKVRILTTEDRKTIPMGRSYFEEYDSLGTILKNGVLDENGKLLEYWDVDADSGKILRAFYYTNDILRANVKVRYNGNNMEETSYFLPGTDLLMRKILIEYDKAGIRTKFKYYNPRNELASYTEYTNNAQGLPESMKVYDRAGKMTAIYNYTYNSRGDKLTQHQETYSDGDIRDYRFEYEYDSIGNAVVIIFIRDNKPLVYRERQIKYFD